MDRLEDIVEEIAGVKLQRTYDPSAPKGVNGRNSDNSRIRALLGWEPSITLTEGLRSTYAWIYDQYVAKYGGGTLLMAVAVDAAIRRGRPAGRRGATAPAFGRAQPARARRMTRV